MKALKWIVNQPMAAVRFIRRHGRTKTGRLAMIVVAGTVAKQIGGEEVARHVPMVIDMVLNPEVAAINLALMYHRDKDLKEKEVKN